MNTGRSWSLAFIWSYEYRVIMEQGFIWSYEYREIIRLGLIRRYEYLEIIELGLIGNFLLCALRPPTTTTILAHPTFSIFLLSKVDPRTPLLLILCFLSGKTPQQGTHTGGYSMFTGVTKNPKKHSIFFDK